MEFYGCESWPLEWHSHKPCRSPSHHLNWQCCPVAAELLLHQAILELPSQELADKTRSWCFLYVILSRYHFCQRNLYVDSPSCSNWAAFKVQVVWWGTVGFCANVILGAHKHSDKFHVLTLSFHFRFLFRIVEFFVWTRYYFCVCGLSIGYSICQRIFTLSFDMSSMIVPLSLYLIIHWVYCFDLAGGSACRRSQHLLPANRIYSSKLKSH